MYICMCTHKALQKPWANALEGSLAEQKIRKPDLRFQKQEVKKQVHQTNWNDCAQLVSISLLPSYFLTHSWSIDYHHHSEPSWDRSFLSRVSSLVHTRASPVLLASIKLPTLWCFLTSLFVCRLFFHLPLKNWFSAGLYLEFFLRFLPFTFIS